MNLIIHQFLCKEKIDDPSIIFCRFHQNLHFAGVLLGQVVPFLAGLLSKARQIPCQAMATLGGFICSGGEGALHRLHKGLGIGLGLATYGLW